MTIRLEELGSSLNSILRYTEVRYELVFPFQIPVGIQNPVHYYYWQRIMRSVPAGWLADIFVPEPVAVILQAGYWTTMPTISRIRDIAQSS